MKSNKSQAAMEFLMTYSWAILAAIIAIGALFYFGAFNTGNYVTGKAIISPPFYIDGYDIKSSLGTNGGIEIDLRNSPYYEYNIFNISIEECGINIDLINMKEGTKINTTILCDSTHTLYEGKNFKSKIIIYYYKVGGTRELKSEGVISKKITN